VNYHEWVAREFPSTGTHADVRAEFLGLVAVTADDTSCWTWLGARAGSKTHRYGRMGIDGVTCWAHRISWEMANGRPAGSLLVRHRCDNPPCVRPSHLLLGTHRDNSRDCQERDRTGGLKIASAEVVNVQRRSAAGETTYAIAADYGVTQGVISKIALGRSHMHVDRETRDKAFRRGDQHSRCKVSDADAASVGPRLLAGDTRAALAAEFGVDPTVITKIAMGQSHRHVAQAVGTPRARVSRGTIEAAIAAAPADTNAAIAARVGVSPGPVAMARSRMGLPPMPRGPRPGTVSDAARDRRIAGMLTDGRSYADTARAIGVHRQRISQIAKRLRAQGSLLDSRRAA
jgi:DNA-binding CsgD family transcriptional regulator